MCRSFAFSLYFYGNLGKRLTCMCSQPNDKYKCHSRGPNTQENVSYVLVFMFRLMFIFRILISWKATYSHLSFSLLEICTKAFSVFGGQYRTEIKAKTSFSWGRYFKYANGKYRYSYTNIFFWTHYESQFHMVSVYLIV